MSVLDNIRFIFLYIDKYSMGKEWYFPEAVIPYNMLRYICKGSAEFFIDGEKVEVKENQIVYIPIGCRMSCQATSDSFEFYSIRFTTSVVYEGEDLLKRFYGFLKQTDMSRQCIQYCIYSARCIPEVPLREILSQPFFRMPAPVNL